jgi:hypothetical protein
MQIKSAILKYKEKGKMSSFEILFQALGYDVEVYELWWNENTDEVKRASEIPLPPDYIPWVDVPAEWYPHSRIDVEVTAIDQNAVPPAYFASVLDWVVARMEEVRPIHVLLPDFIYIVKVFESFPETTDVLQIFGTMRLYDKFRRKPRKPECLTLFYGENPTVDLESWAIGCCFGWQRRFYPDPPGAGAAIDPYDFSRWQLGEIIPDSGGLVHLDNWGGYFMNNTCQYAGSDPLIINKYDSLGNLIETQTIAR